MNRTASYKLASLLVCKAALLNMVQDHRHLLGLEMTDELHEQIVAARGQRQLDRVRVVLGELRYQERSR